MDKIELDVTYSSFSIRMPNDLHEKVKYICKRRFMSKKQVILTCAAQNIERWCKDLMDEEVSIRTGKATSSDPTKVFLPNSVNPEVAERLLSDSRRQAGLNPIQGTMYHSVDMHDIPNHPGTFIPKKVK